MIKGVEALENVDAAGLLLCHDGADRVVPPLLDVGKAETLARRGVLVLVDVNIAPVQQHAFVQELPALQDAFVWLMRNRLLDVRFLVLKKKKKEWGKKAKLDKEMIGTPCTSTPPPHPIQPGSSFLRRLLVLAALVRVKGCDTAKW